MTRQTDHYRDLDGIRGILAMAIVFYHYGINVVLARLSGGFLTDVPWAIVVDFFFILSGCVLARSYARRPRGFGERLVERFFRLMPVHLVILTAMIPLYFAMGTERGWFITIDQQGPWRFVSDFTATTVFLGFRRFNGPSWSMNIELYLPVVLAAAVPLVWRARTAVIWGVLGLLLVAEAYFCYRMALIDEQNLLARGLAGLSAGGLLFALIDRGAIKVPETRWVLPGLFAVFVVLILLSSPYPLVAVTTPVLAMLIVVMGTRSHGILGGGVFGWLGAQSYTNYMVHQPLKAFTYFLLGVERLDGALGVKAILLVSVLVVGVLLTRFIEKPGMALGKVVLNNLRSGAPARA